MLLCRSISKSQRDKLEQLQMRRRRRMDSFSYVTYFPAKKNNGIWRETEANNSQSIRGTIPEATSATTIALQCVVRIQWQMDNNHHITISLPNPERRGFKYFDRPPNNPPLRDQFKWEALFTISWQTEQTASSCCRPYCTLNLATGSFDFKWTRWQRYKFIYLFNSPVHVCKASSHVNPSYVGGQIPINGQSVVS